MLSIVVSIYFSIGIGYAVYILLAGSNPWYYFPLNVIGGPISITYYLYKYAIKKDLDPRNIRFKDILKNKKAVFFDLDGTLLDTDLWWVGAIKQVVESNNMGFVLPEKAFESGRGMEDIWKDLIAFFDLKIPKEKKVNDLVEETNKTFVSKINQMEILDFKAGFWPLVDFLANERGLVIGLLTNTSKEVVEAILTKVGAGNTFDFIICREDIKRKKPNPEIYLKGARILKLKAKEILVFEDSPTGSKAAAKAGMDQIIIWNGIYDQNRYKGNIYNFYADFEGLEVLLATPQTERVIKGLEEFQKKKGILIDKGKDNLI